MTNITADGDTLMRQAHMTASVYMSNAIADIDGMLGKGYAKQHPELIAAYMKTAALDMGAATLAKEIAEALGMLAEALTARESIESPRRKEKATEIAELFVNACVFADGGDRGDLARAIVEVPEVADSDWETVKNVIDHVDALVAERRRAKPT